MGGARAFVLSKEQRLRGRESGGQKTASRQPGRAADRCVITLRQEANPGRRRGRGRRPWAATRVSEGALRQRPGGSWGVRAGASAALGVPKPLGRPDTLGMVRSPTAALASPRAGWSRSLSAQCPGNGGVRPGVRGPELRDGLLGMPVPSEVGCHGTRRSEPSQRSCRGRTVQGSEQGKVFQSCFWSPPHKTEKSSANRGKHVPIIPTGMEGRGVSLEGLLDTHTRRPGFPGAPDPQCQGAVGLPPLKDAQPCPKPCPTTAGPILGSHFPN